MYLIYTIVLGCGLVFALPWYGLRFRKYLPFLGERLGYVGEESRVRPIWVHAVSVGELRAVDPLIRELARLRPEQPVVVSTGTATGRHLARARRSVDRVIYFPIDLPFAVRRTLRRIHPEIVIVAETEIWPNFLRESRRRRIPVFLVNGRISDRSLGRYRLAGRWLREVLDGYALLGMQSERDARRILELGAPRDRVAVFGNLKYDAPRAAETLAPELSKFLETWQPLIVAASTAAGEEPLVVEAYRRMLGPCPGAKLLVAPRRPERFDEVARYLEQSGLGWYRRSRLPASPARGEVLLLDTIGELSAVFEHASMVFMGGTLVPHGGHNILEAVRFGKPVVFGPYMDNFRDMASQFLDAGAAGEVRTPEELAASWERLLKEPEYARTMAAAGLRLLEENSGATHRVLTAILGSGSPERDRTGT